MFGIKKEDKKVEYLELIYDLIFVYLIGRNSSLVQHVENGFINGSLFLTYILCTLIVIQIWNFTTFYVNRYGSNGIKDHICIFVNMYLLYYMADATRSDWHDYFYRYNIAWGLILLNLALQYFLKLRESRKEAPWESAHIRWSMMVLVIEAVIVFASIPVYILTGFPISPIAMVFGIVITMFSGRVHSLVAVDFEHLSERAMLYVVFTFGEMIIAIASYFSGRFNANTVYFSLFAFLIVAGLFVSYEIFYDHLIDREKETNGLLYMLFHVFLIFALNSITVALEFMREEEVALFPKTLFLIGAMLLYYIFLFALGTHLKVSVKPTKAFIFKMIGFAVLFVVLMLIFYQNMYINIAVTVLFVFAIFVVLFRFSRKVQACSE